VSIDELRKASVAPLPKDILLHEMIDSTGDQALEAILVFPNHFTDEQLRWKNIRSVEEEIQKRIEEQDSLRRFVYFRARRSRELTPADRA